MEAKNYVLGFAFRENSNNSVILITKNRPENQKGKLNGVGGKIEEKDFIEAASSVFTTPQIAIAREFLEETGVKTHPKQWDLFTVINFENDVMGGKAVVHCLRTYLSEKEFYSAKTMEDEEINIYSVSEVLNYGYQRSSNLDMLLKMAVNKELKKSQLYF